jgi:hypothetical protein
MVLSESIAPDFWVGRFTVKPTTTGTGEHSENARFDTREQALSWIAETLPQFLDEKCGDQPVSTETWESLSLLAQRTAQWVTWSLKPSREAIGWSPGLPMTTAHAETILRMVGAADPRTAVYLDSAIRLLQNGRSIAMIGLAGSGQDMLAAAVGLTNAASPICGQITNDTATTAEFQRTQIREAIEASAACLNVPSMLADHGNSALIISAIERGVGCCIGLQAAHIKDGIMRMILNGQTHLTDNKIESEIRRLSNLPISFFEVQRTESDAKGYPRITHAIHSGT